MKRRMLATLLVALCGTSPSRTQPADPLPCYFPTNDSLVVEVVGDTVTIWNLNACANCGSVFDITAALVADTVYVVQRDTSTQWAHCLCPFNLRASVTGLRAGRYTAAVYRDFRLMLPTTDVAFVGAVQFEYNPVGSPPFFSRGFQSECLSSSAPQASPERPLRFSLLPNYPNPFNPSTSIRYEIPSACDVRLTVVDLIGRDVAILVDGRQDPGTHEARFDGSNLASGVYICRLCARAVTASAHQGASGAISGFTQIRTVMLLR